MPTTESIPPPPRPRPTVTDGADTALDMSGTFAEPPWRGPPGELGPDPERALGDGCRWVRSMITSMGGVHRPTTTTGGAAEPPTDGDDDKPPLFLPEGSMAAPVAGWRKRQLTPQLHFPCMKCRQSVVALSHVVGEGTWGEVAPCG